MNIFEWFISADANRCGSPMHNTRLEASPSAKKILEHSDRKKYKRSTEPIEFEIILDSELDVNPNGTR
jgi:hypothetical protein